MDEKRRRLQRVALLCALLLLVGTFLSFFIAPHIADARTRRALGLPDDAFVTDTARTSWIYVDEDGNATLYGDKMVGLKTLRIPSAVNGIAVKKVRVTMSTSSSVETVIFPPTLAPTGGATSFRDWENVKSIVFSEEIEDLSRVDLVSLPKLEKIYLPKSLRSLYAYFALQIENKNAVVYYAGTEDEWRALGVAAKNISAKFRVVYNTPVPTVYE